MSENESLSGNRVQEFADGFSPTQQAGLATAAAVLAGAVMAAVGLALDMTRGDVIVAVAALGVVVLVGVVYAFFRAMMLSADENDDGPLSAVTYPLFPVLFVLLSVSVGLFVGIYLRYA